MPTHAHNKAPTADHWVAGGGFSLDVAQRQNAFARQYTLLYRAVRTLSAPLRPSAPKGHALRRRPSVRRPPFGATPAPRAPWTSAVAQRKDFTSSGESAQKCARVHFFLLLITFILEKTRYICNENPFYHLCVAKHRNLSSAQCVRRTAYKLPHLARL